MSLKADPSQRPAMPDTEVQRIGSGPGMRLLGSVLRNTIYATTLTAIRVGQGIGCLTMIAGSEYSALCMGRYINHLPPIKTGTELAAALFIFGSTNASALAGLVGGIWAVAKGGNKLADAIKDRCEQGRQSRNSIGPIPGQSSGLRYEH